jgi:hypothetical protein
MLKTNDVILVIAQAGMTRPYKQYEREQTVLQTLAYARTELVPPAEARGLWDEADVVLPWAWRKTRGKAGLQHE